MMPVAKKPVVCLDCNSVKKPFLKIPGFFLGELVLWLLFLVPGIIYTIMRHTLAYDCCWICGSKRIVPVDTPKGQELTEQNTANV